VCATDRERGRTGFSVSKSETKIVFLKNTLRRRLFFSARPTMSFTLALSFGDDIKTLTVRERQGQCASKRAGGGLRVMPRPN
jgi:hypothetical protein